MSITSDEVNFLVYRYLQENGFAHSAFTFAYESLVVKSSAAQTEIPPGALITFLQKGLEYIAIEEHIGEDGTIQEFENDYSLLSPLICEAIAVKEDRRARRSVPDNTTSTQPNGSLAQEDVVKMDEGAASTDGAMELAANNKSLNLPPSTISLAQQYGDKVLQLLGHQGEVFMCVWNPVRRQLASGSADGICRLWGLWEMNDEKWLSNTNGSNEITLRTAIMPHTSFEGEKYKDVTSVTWSPDGKFLATGCYDGKARIWSNRGKLITRLQEHTGPVFSLKWSKNGQYILSGSYDRRAIVWSAETGKIVKSFLLHEGPVLDVDWKDGDIFATCSSDRTICICQTSHPENNVALHKFAKHDDEVNAVAWSPGGELLASCSDDSTAKIWSLRDGLCHDLRSHSKEIFTLRWTPGGALSNNPTAPLYLCTASFDGTVKVWNGFTGMEVFSLSRHGHPVYSLSPHPNGRILASGSLGGNVSIWSLETGENLREMQSVGDTFDVSWSQDGGMLCACFSSGNLLVVEADISRIGQRGISPKTAIMNSEETIQVVDSAHTNERNGDRLSPIVKAPSPVNNHDSSTAVTTSNDVKTTEMDVTTEDVEVEVEKKEPEIAAEVHHENNNGSVTADSKQEGEQSTHDTSEESDDTAMAVETTVETNENTNNNDNINNNNNESVGDVNIPQDDSLVAENNGTTTDSKST